ncbi:MAG: Tex family protein [Clostridiales bacterium]|nr:Tex family protein [Clostridiales bacterium]MDU1041470.1 Tex family protein [Clostridiales bacterium]
MNITEILSKELSIKNTQAEAVIRLIDDGNTIPFISRYRKEATGGLNDEILRTFDDRLRYLRNLAERKETILASIQEQGKLTDVLKKEIDEAETSVQLEDIYRPYKPKRRTRAMLARERGLEKLAAFITDPDTGISVTEEAKKYIDPDKDVSDSDAAIAGALDIIAEDISDSPDFRTWVRNRTFSRGNIVSSAKEKDPQPGVYDNYYDYSEAISKIPGHRLLALNRGEKEKVLNIKIEAPEADIISYLEKHNRVRSGSDSEKYLKKAIADSYKRLIAPSIETEIRNELTENAEDSAVKVFGINLTQLLMQAPVSGKTVLGWDPGFRTGCKISVVDSTGKVLDTAVIYPTAPQNKVAESMAVIEKLIKKYHVDVISLGNGTASRESEKIIADFIRTSSLPVQYVIVNEAGASVYSASKLATEEFPHFDVGQRSAASMARRLQDPLAELVKIDPRSIGVGQYQHDMNQAKLGEQLGAVVEDCVNKVGVDVNTASAPLLSYISGVNKTIAKNIVLYREENGIFRSRKELLKVAKLGPKAFEQCAGFLRIRGGSEALDMTSVHPESYPAAKALLKYLDYTDRDIIDGSTRDISKKIKEKKISLPDLARELNIGEFTLEDIIGELAKPGRDPREDLPSPVLRSDILDLSDLKIGMTLKGTVRNVIDFGAFVDIGVHQDGLIHISELSDRFIKHPLDVVKVGDIVDVKIISIDTDKKKIGLSMKK